MSDTTRTPEPTERKALVLDKPVRNSLADATTVAAKRSRQRHVLPAGMTRTLCNIDTVKWSERADLADDATITCPLCVASLKAAAQAEQDVADS